MNEECAHIRPADGKLGKKLDSIIAEQGGPVEGTTGAKSTKLYYELLAPSSMHYPDSRRLVQGHFSVNSVAELDDWARREPEGTVFFPISEDDFNEAVNCSGNAEDADLCTCVQCRIDRRGLVTRDLTTQEAARTGWFTVDRSTVAEEGRGCTSNDCGCEVIELTDEGFPVLEDHVALSVIATGVRLARSDMKWAVNLLKDIGYSAIADQLNVRANVLDSYANELEIAERNRQRVADYLDLPELKRAGNISPTSPEQAQQAPIAAVIDQ